MGHCLAAATGFSTSKSPAAAAGRWPRLMRATVIVLAATATSGCLFPSIRGAPPRPMTVEAELAAAQMALQPVNFSNAYSDSYRNQVVSERMWAIDLHYTRFATELSRERRNIGFLSALGIVSLTQTATLMTPVVTKDILTGIASGVVVAQQSYDQEILADRTVQVLLLQMQASRARIATRILLGLRSPTSDYPLILALQDLEDYYRAGTIPGALSSVTEAAGSDARAAEAAKATVTAARFVEDESGEILRRNLFPDGSTVDQDRLQQVLDRMRTLGITADISLLMRGDSFSGDRERLVRSLGWD